MDTQILPGLLLLKVAHEAMLGMTKPRKESRLVTCVNPPALAMSLYLAFSLLSWCPVHLSGQSR